jgi:hypothetical protein
MTTNTIPMDEAPNVGGECGAVHVTACLLVINKPWHAAPQVGVCQCLGTYNGIISCSNIPQEGLGFMV